ncbi:MAG: phosphate ABC transporter permease PstA [Verrucomicrobia bacterium]|nr:phosphate ABC transporter permease PstA [Verrucomicrobiota bacterium]
MGLGVGILLIIGLLGIILKNGLSMFWPDTIYQVELVENSNAGPRNGQDFAGAIALERYKRLQEEGVALTREFQFFTGNKEVYGQMYHFVDSAEIVRDEAGTPRFTPADGILQLERIEFGDALGYPIAIDLADGSSVTDPEALRSTLFETIEASNQRLKAYTKIEKNQIGRINGKMESIRLEQRALREELGETAAESSEKMQQLSAQREQLQAEYDELAAEARALRDRRAEDSIRLRLPSGEERRIGFENITQAHFPNEMSLPGKVGFFLKQIGRFVSEAPREANTEGGIFPAIFGTFVMTLLMSIAVMPFGVVAAIYLREYASQGVIVRAVRISVNNLAGVPSIVYGVFGLGFFVYVLGGSIDELFFSKRLPTATFGTGGILWASLTLALMTVPVVIVATEEALSAVPRGMREAALACGASKWQTIQRIVLPASAPGILTGLILAMARGAGEVAPLMLVGVVKLAPTLPLDGEFPFVHLDRKFMHLGFHIYDLAFQSPDSDAAKPMVFATTLLLIVLVIVLNLSAITIRNHLRRKYKGDTF